ncbi:MAG: nucleotidyltransferase family protein [Nitrospinae bacterium]|nr:nucleotidyltransferase family protein [Nitrospinota bacterium]
MKFSCWPASFPTPAEEMFLKAAILEGEDGARAWQDWKSREDIHSVDYPVYRLLPALYLNLKKNAIEDPLLPKLKGIYKYAWAKNQILLKTTSLVLEAFNKENIPTILLKGLPLVLLAYKHSGGRFMDDVDLLVHPEKVVQAITLLRNSGWVPIGKNVMKTLSNLEERLDFLPSGFAFKNENDVRIDFHRKIKFEPHRFYSMSNSGIWENSIRLTVNDVPTATLCPSDMLLHVCVHGVPWNDHRPFRWVVDSMKIIEAWPDLDWDQVVARTEQLEIQVPANAALSYLNEKFKAPIPKEVLLALSKIPITSKEEKRFNYYTSSAFSKSMVFSPLPILWAQYKNLLNENPELIKRLGIIGYFQFCFNLDHIGQFPKLVFLKLAQRLIIRLREISKKLFYGRE